MKWIKCNDCENEWGVADMDDTCLVSPACDICGGQNWSEVQGTKDDIMVLETIRDRLIRLGHIDIANYMTAQIEERKAKK